MNDRMELSLSADDERLRREIERARAEERQRVDQFLASLEEQLYHLQRSFEEHVVKCALAVAERIVKREIARDQEFVLTQVREALKRVVGVSRIQLRVHPSDEALLHHRRAGLMEASDSLREIAIEVDETIEPGGCIIESESGSVDAQLSTQLKQIEEALLAGVHS
jgi:flagellar assembly protein FliH